MERALGCRQGRQESGQKSQLAGRPSNRCTLKSGSLMQAETFKSETRVGLFSGQVKNAWPLIYKGRVS